MNWMTFMEGLMVLMIKIKGNPAKQEKMRDEKMWT